MNWMQTLAYNNAKRTAFERHLEALASIKKINCALRQPENKQEGVVIIANPALYEVLGKSYKGISVESIEKSSQLHFAGDYDFFIYIPPKCGVHK